MVWKWDRECQDDLDSASRNCKREPQANTPCDEQQTLKVKATVEKLLEVSDKKRGSRITSRIRPESIAETAKVNQRSISKQTLRYATKRAQESQDSLRYRDPFVVIVPGAFGMRVEVEQYATKILRKA